MHGTFRAATARTRHAEQREGEAHGSPVPPLVRDAEYDKGVAQRRSEQNGERRSTDAIDLRSSMIIDLRSSSSSSDAITPPSETTPSEVVPTRLIILSDSASLPCDGVYVRHIKPFVDRVVAAVLLVLLSPLILVIALGLLVTLKRPIIFRQIRVGRNGVPFVLWKFRTMRPDRRKTNLPTPVKRRVCHKSPDDPRHTRFGRALRCTRLDELPQLANVLKGDMSLVGPRPEMTEIVARYEPWQHDRHLVRPGLTGLWQVSVVGEGLMHEHTELDIEYIQAMDLKTDLRILLRTPAALVLRRGAERRCPRRRTTPSLLALISAHLRRRPPRQVLSIGALGSRTPHESPGHQTSPHSASTRPASGSTRILFLTLDVMGWSTYGSTMVASTANRRTTSMRCISCFPLAACVG